MKKFSIAHIALIASLAHAANVGYCQAIGEPPPAPWPEFTRQANTINGVEFVLANPESTPAEQHANWLKGMTESGWTFGETRDEGTKTHPCIKPYDELPVEQRAKDHIFRATVLGSAALITALGDEAAVLLEAAQAATQLAQEAVELSQAEVRSLNAQIEALKTVDTGAVAHCGDALVPTATDASCVGRLRVGKSFLADALNLPRPTDVLGARDGADGEIELLIAHELLPAVVEGEPIPRVSANFISGLGGGQFVGWQVHEAQPA